MYLHLGQSVVVPYRDVVGIFDLDNTSASHRTRRMLDQAQREGRVINVSDELPKSFVVCDHPYHRQIVYLSQLLPATLQGRAESKKLEL